MKLKLETFKRYFSVVALIMSMFTSINVVSMDCIDVAPTASVESSWFDRFAGWFRGTIAGASVEKKQSGRDTTWNEASLNDLLTNGQYRCAAMPADVRSLIFQRVKCLSVIAKLSSDTQTAFWQAIFSEDAEVNERSVIGELIRRGADINAYMDETALWCLFQSNFFIRKLNQIISRNPQHNFSKALVIGDPLAANFRQGPPGAVSQTLIGTLSGYTPLMACLLLSHTQGMNTLLNLGCDTLKTNVQNTANVMDAIFESFCIKAEYPSCQIVINKDVLVKLRELFTLINRANGKTMCSEVLPFCALKVHIREDISDKFAIEQLLQQQIINLQLWRREIKERIVMVQNKLDTISELNEKIALLAERFSLEEALNDLKSKEKILRADLSELLNSYSDFVVRI